MFCILTYCKISQGLTETVSCDTTTYGLASRLYSALFYCRKITSNNKIDYQLSLLHISKNDMKRLISSFVECTEKLRKAIPTSVYNQIIRTDNNAKIAALRKFI